MDILAGHLLGDILLQNRWLARVKRDTVLGMVLHCTLATWAVCIMTGWWDYRTLLVYIAHFLIDRFAIGKTIWPLLLDQGHPDSLAPAPLWLRLLDDQAMHVVALALIGMLPV